MIWIKDKYSDPVIRLRKKKRRTSHLCTIIPNSFSPSLFDIPSNPEQSVLVCNGLDYQAKFANQIIEQTFPGAFRETNLRTGLKIKIKVKLKMKNRPLFGLYLRRNDSI